MSVIFYSDITDIIQNLEVKGSKYGLERTEKLLQEFGCPDKKLNIIHIAGSNGKGSIAAFITNILICSGYKVGTFTSPQAYSYAEKFLFDNKPSEEIIKYFLSEVYSFSQTLEDKPTAFEIETVAALAAFAALGCEYAVVECGLGGRDDATNAVSSKRLAVISSVSLEHTAILGDSVGQICAHKVGIIKNCPAIISGLQSDEGRKFLSAYTDKFAGDGLEITSRSLDGQTFAYGNSEYFIKMLGDAQCYNAAVAIDVAKALKIGNCKIISGLATTNLAGRCEIIKNEKGVYILDGAHNFAAFSPLLNVLNGINGEKTLAFGCLSDKDVNAISRLLAPHFSKIILFPPPSYRAMDKSKMLTAFESAGAECIVEWAENVGQALTAAGGGIVAVCGTFTLLKEAKLWIGNGR